ncbi:N-terminal phage integrase SAM-like domain-containing protein [Gemmiger formicilis]|nr:N-terminal phage integrase SAM-like domain-containing protein [Gemmiger formicilis]
MKDTSKTSLRRGHNEGNIRQRTDGRWEVRLSAGIDYKTGKPRRTSTCCNTRQEAIAILQQQAHEVRTQGWRDSMSVTLGEWYEYWLDTYMKDTVKQSTYASYRSYLNKHFCVLGKILLKSLNRIPCRNFTTTNSARKAYPQDLAQLPHGIA